jgi:hypothetical protein
MKIKQKDMNLKRYKIITVETGERMHDFLAVNDKEAITLFDIYIKRICTVHGEALKQEYILKEELDELNERIVIQIFLLPVKRADTKKVFYNKQEVGIYYTSGINKENEADTWINVVVKGGKRIELKGKAAVKLLKKL